MTAIFDGTNAEIRVAINGVVDASTTPFWNYIGMGRMWIGRNKIFPTEYLEGDIDELRISSTARFFWPVSTESRSWGRVKALWGSPDS